MKLPYQGFHELTVLLQDSLDFKMHAQGSLEMGFLIKGSCRYVCSSREYELKAGDVFIAFPNQPHAFYESRDLSAYLLIIPINNYLSAYYSVLTKLIPATPVLHAGQWDPEILEILKYAYKDAQTASATVMQGYLQVIFGKILGALHLQEHRSGAEGALQKVLAFLNDNYREPLTRSQIARSVGYNESYVSHLFADTMQMSIPEYINMLRIDDARSALQRSSTPISQIATDLGFGSIRSFNRVFHIYTGMTPRDFRVASPTNK